MFLFPKNKVHFLPKAFEMGKTMIRICPYCYTENMYTEDVCVKCGKELASNAEEYINKLLWALNHPVSEVRLRAVKLMANLQMSAYPRIKKMLHEIFITTDDLYMQKAIIETLGEIGGLNEFLFMLEQINHPSILVRSAAISYFETHLAQLSAKDVAILKIVLKI
jgi:HEAT repeat protein